jgi:lysine decarboxylase/arginine decarboxylase
VKRRSLRESTYKILVISAPAQGVAEEARRLILDELTTASDRFTVRHAHSAQGGQAAITADPSFHVIVVDWELDGAEQVLRAIRRQNKLVPVFLMTQSLSTPDIRIEVMSQVSELIGLFEDTAPFIAGRIEAAAERYVQAINPPMFRALVEFGQQHEYSWHTPGHAGGTAFLKTAVSEGFYDYFGANLFRADLSISVPELGSLLDHSGPIGQSEKLISRVFGSDRSYSVTGGTSMSNRVVTSASLTPGDIALVDRNCHKSIEQSITATGATPVYLMPQRNYLGIIGPIAPGKLAAQSVELWTAESPLAAALDEDSPGRTGRAAMATITNSTYDGLAYNAAQVIALLDPSVDRIHFDEAWSGHATFNPLYKGTSAMEATSGTGPGDGPTLFATQSTHKLLAALSQASYIHVRDGRRAIPPDRFDEAYMMHATTSPLYTILASNEIAAAMMDQSGELLTSESIREAIEFRQTVMSYHRDFARRGGWFFTTWNPPFVGGSQGSDDADRVPFADAPLDLLATTQECWALRPGDAWHGYRDLVDGYAMLDPIKVSVVTPGLTEDGGFEAEGIPAAVFSAYLRARGIVPEKTTDFTVLFLFSLGVTGGKWGSLLSAMLEFKRDYDANVPLEVAAPEEFGAAPRRYRGLGLRDLCREMFAHLKASGHGPLEGEAFARLPSPDVLPRLAYQELVRGRVELVPLDRAQGRTVATGVTPYPPGIPLLMPGENVGPDSGAVLGYLRSLEAFDRAFPGFAYAVHGVDISPDDGAYRLQVLATS